MELEPPKIVSEYDIILKTSPFPLHMIQYPLRGVNSHFDSFLKLSDARLKPKQHKLEFNYVPLKNFENLRTKTQDDSKINYSFNNEMNHNEHSEKSSLKNNLSFNIDIIFFLN
jgi:hypothetical protein